MTFGLRERAHDVDMDYLKTSRWERVLRERGVDMACYFGTLTGVTRATPLPYLPFHAGPHETTGHGLYSWYRALVSEAVNCSENREL